MTEQLESENTKNGSSSIESRTIVPQSISRRSRNGYLQSIVANGMSHSAVGHWNPLEYVESLQKAKKNKR